MQTRQKTRMQSCLIVSSVATRTLLRIIPRYTTAAIACPSIKSTSLQCDYAIKGLAGLK
jgi:hypothetical protein